MPLTASSDDSVANHSRTTRTLPPISPEGFGGCLLWLLNKTSGREPDHELLTRGLPQGRIKSARVTGDGSIAVVIQDQHYRGRKRTARAFDPEGFFVLRALCAPKSHIRIDRNGPNRHYVTLYGDITAIRVIAGAQSGQDANHLGEHYDLRRENLYLTMAPQRVHQDRPHLAKLSLGAFDKLGENFWLRRLVSRDDLAWILDEGFRLLDKLPLGTQAAIAKQDEHRP